MQNIHYGRYAQGFGLPKETQTIPAFTNTETEAQQRLSGLPFIIERYRGMNVILVANDISINDVMNQSDSLRRG